MSEIKPGDDITIELRSPVRKSRVTVNGAELQVTSVSVRGDASDDFLMVEMELPRKPSQDPIIVKGTFISEGFEVKESPLQETVPGDEE